MDKMITIEKGHHYGTYVGDQPMHAAEALEKIGLEPLVRSEPIFLADGTEISSHVANVRGNQTHGIVGVNYCIVQDNDAFSVVDSLVDSGEALIHTVGFLRDGAKIWAQAKIGDSEVIPGDKVDHYLMFYNSHDGSGALKIFWVRNRLLCNNQVASALRGFRRNQNGIALKHTRNIADRMQEARNILGISQEFHAQADAFEQRLAQTPLTSEQWEGFANEIIPDPKPRTRKNAKVEVAYTSEDARELSGSELLADMLDSGEKKAQGNEIIAEMVQKQNNTRAENNRKLLLELLNDGTGQDLTTPEGERVSNTLWGARNAVSEYVNFHKGTRKTNGASEEERRFESAIFGAGAQMVQQADNLLWDILDA